MKKKILGIIVIAVVAITGAININLSRSTNGIMLKNIEALASGEG
ncbi:MAG: NVEALA domain-containing protein, partial [Butyricimonas virosa]